ncbi:hypothetical protein [Blastopirellula marina]|uniref:Uncharacterized protein n=1 Tax=Blastopirellula marina DSM 3645 TaxID=314230 RepID=A3ZPK5_9BACT|nr:hypothetical protein [Blastopirellula marina]EAQ81683.1 hypothetical protein DSM3645_28917 [Blastopirellula marina DSM 3645]
MRLIIAKSPNTTLPDWEGKRLTAVCASLFSFSEQRLMVTTFTDKLSELLADAQAKLRQGFTWDTFSEAFLTFIHSAMIAAKEELLNPGPEKKAAVLEWVGAFWDFVVAKVPLPTWLFWMKLPYVSTAIRSIILTIAAGLIEGLYTQNLEQFRA